MSSPMLALGSLVLASTPMRSVSPPPPPPQGDTISDAASFAAFMTNANPGDTGIFTGTAADSTFVNNTPRDMAGITLTVAPGAQIGQIRLTGADNLTLDGLVFHNTNPGNVNPDANEAANSMLSLTNCDGIDVQGCSFDGARPDQNYELFQNAIFVTGANAPRITGCQFDNIYRAALIVACGNASLAGRTQFTNNTVRRFVGQAVRVAWADAEVSDNDIRGCIGRSGRRMVGTITGTLSVGDSISLNDAGAHGGQIVAVSAGYVHVKYNSHEKPISAGQYQVRGAPSNYINVSSTADITTAYDPVHSDGFQAINNAATRNHKLLVNRNLIGRLSAAGMVDFPTVSTDNGFPGIRIQKNNSLYSWDIDSRCDQNILTNDTTEPCEVAGFSGAKMRNNLALYSSYSNGAARLRVQGGSTNVDASGNISDYAGGLVDYGNSTQTTGSLRKSPSQYAVDFPFFNRNDPPNDLAAFTPASDLGGAGPLTTTGELRALP